MTREDYKKIKNVVNKKDYGESFYDIDCKLNYICDNKDKKKEIEQLICYIKAKNAREEELALFGAFIGIVASLVALLSSIFEKSEGIWLLLIVVFAISIFIIPLMIWMKNVKFKDTYVLEYLQIQYNELHKMSGKPMKDTIENETAGDPKKPNKEQEKEKGNGKDLQG